MSVSVRPSSSSILRLPLNNALEVPAAAEIAAAEIAAAKIAAAEVAEVARVRVRPRLLPAEQPTPAAQQRAEQQPRHQPAAEEAARERAVRRAGLPVGHVAAVHRHAAGIRLAALADAHGVRG